MESKENNLISGINIELKLQYYFFVKALFIINSVSW